MVYDDLITGQVQTHIVAMLTSPLAISLLSDNMALFMTNICTYRGCGIKFTGLFDLIGHIEDIHIDDDPAVLEQSEASQPACVPMSYVLRFFSAESRREIQNAPPAPEPRRRLLSVPREPSVRSTTPTGSEMDEDEMMSLSEDSNDSWTTADEYSPDYILRYGVKMNPNALSGALGPAAQEKPFACPVPGCKKRYKNVNGIKYHSKNGHKKDGKVKKAYKCQCGKSYKTSQGLKSHSSINHVSAPQASTSSATVTATVASSAPQTEPSRVHVKMPGLVVTASPARSTENIDASKLVRIYDTLKNNTAFTIPKQNLTFVGANQIRHAGIITPNSTPGSSPIEKKFERSPKVTVQSQPLSYVNEH